MLVAAESKSERLKATCEIGTTTSGPMANIELLPKGYFFETNRSTILGEFMKWSNWITIGLLLTLNSCSWTKDKNQIEDIVDDIQIQTPIFRIAFSMLPVLRCESPASLAS